MRTKLGGGIRRTVRDDTETTTTVIGGGDIAQGVAREIKVAVIGTEIVRGHARDGGMAIESVTGEGIGHAAVNTDGGRTAPSHEKNDSQSHVDHGQLL